MQNSLKKKLFEYFKGIENPTEEEKELAKKLECEMYYADIEGMSICTDDVEHYSHKKTDWDELCEIADAMDEYFEDDFGPALSDIIEEKEFCNY